MHEMMKCGHAANAQCSSLGGVTYDPPIPSCAICDCIEIDSVPPDLSGRRARCAYYRGCKSEADSDVDVLPFFEYLGPGSRDATDKCKCGYSRQAHFPKWEAKVKAIRRWYKIDRHEDIWHRSAHWPDEETARLWADQLLDAILHWTNNEETKIFSTELISLKQIHSPMKCKEFTPKGAAEFDQYYCGCHGWD